MAGPVYRSRTPKASPLWQCLFRRFDAFLDFHPHLHALVADGLFQRGGWFHVLPKTAIRPLEELFRARTIAFLVNKGLLPPDRARMLLGWKHSGFCVHCSKRVLPDQKEDLERLAQYTRLRRGFGGQVIRNPFSVESRAEGETGCPQGSNGAKRSGNMHPDPEKQAGVCRL